jgi:hypothetical protein
MASTAATSLICRHEPNRRRKMYQAIAARCVYHRHLLSKNRCLIELADKPVILVGGLTLENVERAILEVRPAGVDSHTGVEDSSGRKSCEKVQKFLSEACEAFEIVKAK